MGQLVQQNTKTRPRVYGDEKEKSGGPAGPAGPHPKNANNYQYLSL